MNKSLHCTLFSFFSFFFTLAQKISIQIEISTDDVKAELPKEGILFRTQFPSLGIFINKKVGFRKN